MGIRDLLKFDNRWELIAGRIFFRPTSLQVYRINGLQVLVDNRAADAGSIRHCIATDLYSRYLPKLKLPAAPNVLDLGANAGGFPLLLATRDITPGNLLCIELNPNTCQRLRFNIETNFAGARVINAAVVGSPREIKVRLGRGSTADSIYTGPSRLGLATGGHALRRPNDNEYANEYTVSGLSLDNIVDTHFGHATIDLCKMDIEGAEDEVVAGTECESLRRIRYLLVEIHNRENYERFITALAQRGLTEIAGDGQIGCGVRLFHNPSL
ncbi:MAG TPA: FkbM family methyltransferase [Tepidisphaeraceae bacterium]|nr:FkbM family methyltransferase [Tepidisphaeraceae bacterium]